jgi:hypothetical protein
VPTGAHRRITKQIRQIRASLVRTERLLRRLAPLVRDAERAAKRGAAPRRRTLRLSPARRRTLKLQGSYMGYMRQLARKEKARVKAAKEKKGFRVAIAMARKLARRVRG